MNRSFQLCFRIALLLAVMAAAGMAQTTIDPDFPPFEQWKRAVLDADSAALMALYSTDPPAKVWANKVETDGKTDVAFWLGLNAKVMKIEIVRVKTRADREGIIFNAQVLTGNEQTVNVSDDQIWQQQGDRWLLRSVTRTDAPKLKQPSDMKKDIYPADADAHAELRLAEEQAARDHRRVLLVFGANWCYDCHVLDLAFHRDDLAPVLAANYEVVHVDLGPDETKNDDLVKQFDVPLNKGIPALAVAEPDGKLVVSQKNGEFENARGLAPDVLLAFLNKWKP